MGLSTVGSGSCWHPRIVVRVPRSGHSSVPGAALGDSDRVHPASQRPSVRHPEGLAFRSQHHRGPHHAWRAAGPRLPLHPRTPPRTRIAHTLHPGRVERHLRRGADGTRGATYHLSKRIGFHRSHGRTTDYFGEPSGTAHSQGHPPGWLAWSGKRLSPETPSRSGSSGAWPSTRSWECARGAAGRTLQAEMEAAREQPLDVGDPKVIHQGADTCGSPRREHRGPVGHPGRDNRWRGDTCHHISHRRAREGRDTVRWLPESSIGPGTIAL